MAEKVQDEDIASYDIPDPEMNTEAMAIAKMELDILKNCMEELTAEDREFLLACFESERGSVAELTKKLGIPQTTISSHKKRLFEKIKKRFLEKYETSICS